MGGGRHRSRRILPGWLRGGHIATIHLDPKLADSACVSEAYNSDAHAFGPIRRTAAGHHATCRNRGTWRYCWHALHDQCRANSR